MLLILSPGGKLILQDQVSGRIVYAPLFGLRAVSFLILRLGGKLITQDQVSGRIAYAPLFGLRAVSLYLLFCARAGSLLYKSRRPA